MKNYVIYSLETHLFFSRIMKEHSLFLLASFPAKETDFIQYADQFRREFEEGLRQTVMLANNVVGNAVLDSGEIVTEFTQKAECRTQNLTGIPIDTEITVAEQQLHSGCPAKINENLSCSSAAFLTGRNSQFVSREMVRKVRILNRQMLKRLRGLIAFKETILKKVLDCRLYTANYPLLIEHILREAKLYHQILMQLEEKRQVILPDLRNLEIFWNQIMMEHAQFIRGLLDPTECELIETADGFARDYSCLLEEAKAQDLKAMNALTAKTLITTKKYQQFKMAGTEGITGCQIRSVILPLLADHVLREANHYLRILENGE